MTWWKASQEDLTVSEIEVKDGRVVGSDHLAGALFSTTRNTLPTGETYMIEQVELTDDGLVEVTCSNWPEYGAQSTRLTGGPVAPGDSVVTTEVFGKPRDDNGGGGGGGGDFEVCKQNLSFYNKTEPCQFVFFEPTGIQKVDGSCYPGSHALGTNPPYSCLLYTSPSPRDRTRSRMPSSA